MYTDELAVASSSIDFSGLRDLLTVLTAAHRTAAVISFQAGGAGMFQRLPPMSVRVPARA